MLRPRPLLLAAAFAMATMPALAQREIVGADDDEEDGDFSPAAEAEAEAEEAEASRAS